MQNQLEILMAVADEAFASACGRSLTPLEKHLLKGALTGCRYKEIYQALPDIEKDSADLKRNAFQRSRAFQFWRQLTIALQKAELLAPDEKIGLKNASKVLTAEALQKAGLLAPDEKIGLKNAREILERSRATPKPVTVEVMGDRIAWVGRRALVQQILDELRRDVRIISLVGISGIGKTSLAARLTYCSQLKQQFPSFHIIRFAEESPTHKKTPDFATIAQAILGQAATSSEQDINTSMHRVLQILRDQPHLLILDMAEVAIQTATPEQTQFRDRTLQRFVEALVTEDLMASALIFTSQLKLPPILEGRYPVRMAEHRLTGLVFEEVTQLFAAWDILSGSGHRDILQELSEVYEGHPLALKVIAGEVRCKPYNGSLTAYWHDYRAELEQFRQWMANEQTPTLPRLESYSCDLTALVRSRLMNTLDHLEKTDPLAHHLLCMGSTYRPAVEREAWLTMEPEVPRGDLIDAFQSLQRRFLLEPERPQSSQILYRLHNLVRCTALDRLARLEPCS